MKDRVDRVYFAFAGGRIKIGTTTTDVLFRLKNISNSLPEPLVLIGDILGGFALERAVHRHFEPFKIKGEWFRDCAELRADIQKILDEGASSLGIVARSTPTIVPSPPANERDPAVWGHIVRLMWPDDALAQLMAYSTLPEADCRAFLRGERSPPRLVRDAMASVLVQFIFKDGESAPDFVSEGSDGWVLVRATPEESREVA